MNACVSANRLISGIAAALGFIGVGIFVFGASGCVGAVFGVIVVVVGIIVGVTVGIAAGAIAGITVVAVLLVLCGITSNAVV